MAASTRSFGMLTLLAFWKQRRRAGLVAVSGPPTFTAMAISFPMRVNCLAIRSQRANMVCLRTSKMRPIYSVYLVNNLFYRPHQPVKPHYGLGIRGAKIAQGTLFTKQKTVRRVANGFLYGYKLSAPELAIVLAV